MKPKASSKKDLKALKDLKDFKALRLRLKKIYLFLPQRKN